jgi:phage shock protein PspC (stress-responsive transcriptional regulator)
MADEQSTTRTGAPSRLVRVPEGRVLAGVCTGLGRYTGIDPVVFRVGFGILVLAQGQGIPLYVAAALFMPAEAHRDAVAEKVFRRRFDAPAVLTVLGGLLCALVAFSVVGTGLIGLLGGKASTDALAVLTVVGLILLVAHSRGIDLVATARSLPERLQGYPQESEPEVAEGTSTPVSFEKTAPAAGGLPEGAVDLATLGGRRAPSGATATAPPPVKPGHSCGGGAMTLKGRHGRPALTSITLLAALVAVAGLWPVAQPHPGPEATMILLSVALAVVGCGMLAGGWFRARGLATMGTVLTCALLTTSVAAAAPPEARYG